MSEESSITTIQYDSIIKRLDIMQETMDRRFQEWSEDRKLITDLEVRLKTVEAKLDGARDDIADNNKKMINRVDEHLEPVSEIVSVSVKDAISDIKKKRWYDILRRK